MGVSSITINVNNNGGPGSGGSNTASTTPTTIQDQQKKTKQSATTWKQLSMLKIGEQTGKTLINYAVTNYGDMTGDYITQSKINIGMNVASSASSIAVAGITAGPIGVAASVGMLAIQETLKWNSRINQRKKEDAVAKNLAIRTGLYKNGGSR